MPTIVYTPDAILAQANFGTAPTTANLSAQDASWAVASANTSNTDARVSFSHPSATVTGAFVRPGAGLQTFTVEARKNGGTGTPSVTIAIFENGTQRAVSSAINVTNTSSQLLSFTWNGSLLTDGTGAGVECRVLTTAAGGGPSARASVDFGYIAWTADYDIDTTPPTITSSATFNVAENAAFSTTLTADEAVTWTKVGGADQALFTLTGPTLSMTAKDFEIPVDADTNNTYLVTVRATDAAGNFTEQNITVTVTDVANPVITSANTASNIEGTVLAHALTVASGSPVWTIVGGTDSTKFEIVGTTLRWTANGTKSFSAPDDSNTDNVYQVIVRATTASEFTNQTINVTVGPLEITTSSAQSTNEHAGAAIALTVASGSPTWSLVGGADQVLFTLSGSTLYLQPRDFESPVDANLDNVYEVTVRATVGGSSVDKTISVTVLDISPEDKIYPRRFYNVNQSYALVNHISTTTQSNLGLIVEWAKMFPNRRVGDVLILTITHPNLGLNPPTGFTFLASSTGQGVANAADAVRVSVYYRVVDGSEVNWPSYGTSAPTGGTSATSYYASIHCYAGVNNIEDIKVIQISDTTVLPALSQESQTNNSRWFLVAGTSTAIASPTYPSGGGLGTPNTNDSNLYASRNLVFSAPIPTAGTGTPTALSWTNTANAEAIQFVLRAGNGTAPTINTAASQNASENSAGSMSLAANCFVYWSIVPGADSSQFLLGRTFGTAKHLYIQPQDFDYPIDANLDNIYTVVLRATNSEGIFADKTINVSIIPFQKPAIYARAFSTETLTTLSLTTLSSIASNAISATPTVSLPLNRRVNDVMVMTVGTANKEVAVPVGWTEAHPQTGFGTADSTTAHRVATFWRRVNGTEADTITLTITGGTTQNNFWIVQNFAGMITTGTPFVAVNPQQQTVAASSYTFDTATTAKTYSRVLFSAAHGTTTSSINVPNPADTAFKAGAGVYAANRGASAHSWERASIGGVSTTLTPGVGTITAESIALVLDRGDWTLPPRIVTSLANVNSGLALALSPSINRHDGGSLSIVGGADASHFEIYDTNKVRWLGNGTRDYHSPQDSNADNTYEVILRAQNSAGSSDGTILVSIVEPITRSAVSGAEPTPELYTYNFSAYPDGTKLIDTPNWRGWNGGVISPLVTADGKLSYPTTSGDVVEKVSNSNILAIEISYTGDLPPTFYLYDKSDDLTYYGYSVSSGSIWVSETKGRSAAEKLHSLDFTNGKVKLVLINRGSSIDWYFSLNDILVDSFSDVSPNRWMPDLNGFFRLSGTYTIDSLSTNTTWRPSGAPQPSLRRGGRTVMMF